VPWQRCSCTGTTSSRSRSTRANLRGTRWRLGAAAGATRTGLSRYYPRSGKVSLRGIGVRFRVDRLDYWDGEPG
jgi:hypothetical protein